MPSKEIQTIINNFATSLALQLEAAAKSDVLARVRAVLGDAPAAKVREKTVTMQPRKGQGRRQDLSLQVQQSLAAFPQQTVSELSERLNVPAKNVGAALIRLKEKGEVVGVGPRGRTEYSVR